VRTRHGFGTIWPPAAEIFIPDCPVRTKLFAS
jgi:hypothetical protein